jgi:1-acyl-sn-glycerol-3-phosphate acyltransferase
MESRRNKFDRWCWAEHSVRSIWAVERCGGTVEIVDGDLAKVNKPTVFVANHMSLLETLIMPGPVLVYHDATIVVKQALLDMPFFGRLMRDAGAIGVGRKDPRRDLKVMMERGIHELKNGRSLMIFPQSTRLPKFDPSKFNSIGVKMAVRAGCPVIPVALKTDLLGIGKVMRDFGKVDRSKKVWFKFGEAIEPDVDRKEMHARCVDFIVSNLRSWGAEIEGDATNTGGTKND